MKKILLLLLAGSFLLTGCLETIEEITINDDGSGTVSTTSDLSSLIALTKQMGSGNSAEQLPNEKMDTTISLASKVDSVQNLTDKEKELLKKGSMYMQMDMQEGKFITRLTFPFANTDEIAMFGRITNKVFGSEMKAQVANAPMTDGMAGSVPEISSFNDYYELKFSKGELKKSLNKEKYAAAESDEYLKGIKEAAAMGVPVTATYIINLPRPASKVDGKNVTLSEDKKKVTVKVSIDDFFDDPEKLEFKIKY